MHGLLSGDSMQFLPGFFPEKAAIQPYFVVSGTGKSVVRTVKIDYIDSTYDFAACFPLYFPYTGQQTAPRWLYGLATVGAQPIRGAADLLTPVSPTVKRSLKRLNIAADHVPAALFGPLEMWRG